MFSVIGLPTFKYCNNSVFPLDLLQTTRMLGSFDPVMRTWFTDMVINKLRDAASQGPRLTEREVEEKLVLKQNNKDETSANAKVISLLYLILNCLRRKHNRLKFSIKSLQTQYSAALAITGAWRGTSRQRLYDELGWEDLYHRRWFRRLCHFYNLRKNRQPEYLFDEIPATREISYSLRNVNEYDAAVCRTNRFSNTYFQNVLLEWNALAKDIRESNTLGEFKSKLLKKIRPVKKPLYEICDTRGVRCLTKLRVRFSSLGEHKFRHNFESLSPICTCNTGIEDNEHFLLHCPLYDQMRNDLFDQLSEIPGLELDNLNSEALCELLLFGNPRFNNIANKLILEATISFILSTGRLE